MRYVLRVAVPDLPGSLHALTGVCARAQVDIASLDVIERASGRAIDDLCVSGVAEAAALTAAIDALPATSVLSLRPVESFGDVDGAIALAAALVVEGRGAVQLLVSRLPAALWAGWAIAVARGWNGLEVLAAGPDALAPDTTSWLPLVAPRRLLASDVLGHDGSTDLQLAAAPLGQPTSAIILARRGGPQFADRELRQLDLLAKVAVATEVAHTARRPVERIEPARRHPIRT